MTRSRRLAAAIAVLCLASLAACTSHHEVAKRVDATTPPSASAGPSASAPAVPDDGAPPPMPLGRKSGWKLAFSDEFEGTALDTSRWADRSIAEPDEGRGNLTNQQLEWNQAANCKVAHSELVMTAKRQRTKSATTGKVYEWTSCLLTTRKSFAFQYGFIEERSILPATLGFWPAFWTWQVKNGDKQTETDVYEYYSDNHRRMYSTQYSGARGRCVWTPKFDPSAGWHTYGVAIESTGTTWYADGARVCHTTATSDRLTNIISNLAVYSIIPPAATTTSATKHVDYIRAWTPS